MKDKALKQLERLDVKLKYLFDRLSEHNPEKLVEKPSLKEWSVVEVMNHLMLSEKLSLKYCQKKLSFDPKLKKTNWKTNWNEFVLRTYLSIPIKFKAPKAVGDSAFLSHSNFIESKDQWLTDRKSLKVFLESQDNEVFRKELYKHPFGMRISLNGMLGFFEAHFDRHEKQINRVLRKIKA